MTDDFLHQALQLLWRHTLLCSAAVLLLALLRPLLLRMLGASAAYLAWLLVPLMALSPCLPRPPQQDLAPLASAVSAMAPAPSAAELGPAAAAVSTVPSDILAPLLLTLWLAGALALALLLARRQRRFTARLRTDAAGRWRGPAGSSAALLGLWRPRLVLPQDFETRFDAEEQRLILAHEAVHARRRDNAWNLLGAALLVLQWFNPLAWWALGRMRADQELACDASVLNQLGEEDMSIKHYLAALLKSCAPQHLPVLANGWSPRHPLLERTRMLGRHRRSAGRRRLGALAALSLCAGVTLLARAAQPESPAATPPAASAAPAGPGLGVVLHLDAQQGQQEERHSQLKLELPAHGPVPDALDKRLTLPQGDWCLGVLPYGHPGGTVRPLAQLLDARCQTALTDWVAVPVGRGRYSLRARLDQQDLLARVGLEWTDPKDPRIPEEMQREARELAATSARRQALLEKQRADIAADIARQRTSEAALQQAHGAGPRPAPASAAASAGAQAPAPTPPPAAAPGPAASAPPPASSIRLALDFEVSGRAESGSILMQGKPVMLLKPNTMGAMRIQLPLRRGSAPTAQDGAAAEDALEMQIKVRELEAGQLVIESQLRLTGSGQVLARPTLMVREGERFRIETDNAPGLKFRLDAVATREPLPS